MQQQSVAKFAQQPQLRRLFFEEFFAEVQSGLGEDAWAGLQSLAQLLDRIGGLGADRGGCANQQHQRARMESAIAAAGPRAVLAHGYSPSVERRDLLAKRASLIYPGPTSRKRLAAIRIPAVGRSEGGGRLMSRWSILVACGLGLRP